MAVFESLRIYVAAECVRAKAIANSSAASVVVRGGRSKVYNAQGHWGGVL